MADNIKYRFIQNVGDFFPSGYFGEDFIDKVQKISGYTADQVAEVCSKYVQFRRKYDDYKNRIVTQMLRPKDSIRYTHDFHTELLKLLGYGDLGKPYSEHYILDEDHQELIPVRHILRRNNNVQMLIMEMRPLIKVGDEEPAGLFEQQYDDESEPNKPSRFTASHWSDVFSMPEGYKISPAVVNKAVSRIFLLPENRRPSYILMLAGNTLFLFDKEKWNRGSYLSFTLDDLFSQASISTFRKYYALFHMLVSKETLSPDGESIMMDALVEDSYKNAYEVTKDLKEGVVNAVETLANEALWYWKSLPDDSDIYNPLKTIDYTDDTFEAEVKDDCLTIVYRLLFLFYAESRTELEILPVDDEVYERGYSLEMLRDLEQVRLISDESKRGYFIDASLKKLFYLLSHGHKENQDKSKQDQSFRVRHIDSPMFDDRKLHHLGNVKYRNEKWQQIICALSLSKKKQGKGRGRISYANLGVNQLGSVYESLLAYRGFYAEEDYIEVHKAGHPEDGTFLVPYSRMDDFKENEVLHGEDGDIKILPQGTFVYRLNGRDRQKSASYYTPEVLTRSTVKYTLKAILDDVREGKRKATELLDLKILEPAMGAAAFQNEVINQVAEAYLQYRQAEKRQEYMERNSLEEDQVGDGSWRIAPDYYRDELQKVKAYIATHNVYGVDLNPTAIELGKLSLWLNVIHKDMETPFFSNRLALGNAVIGAWLKVYSKEEFLGIKGRTRLTPNPWWEKAPHKVSFQKNSVKRSVNEIYHFLLPDKNMLSVSTIKDYKDKAKAERADSQLQFKPTNAALERMKAMIDDWTKPISEIEFRRLQKLSSKIDVLLKEYFQFQRSVENLTQNKVNLWGVPGAPQLNLDSYEEKERLNDVRYRHDNAYFRLKMVMDYWCSLWFWNLEDAADLPNREEYWNDIEAMLNVSDEQLDSRTSKALRKRVGVDQKGQLDMFPEGTMNDMFYEQQLEEEGEGASVHEDIELNDKQTEEESEIVTMSKEQILTEVQSQSTDFFGNSLRFKIVDRLSKRYHFFHPMLEFLEVFWLRDGFDIICGNPPWIKLEFDEVGIISEKYPEVAIRNISAPNARKMREQLFAENPILASLYLEEEIENVCSIAFLNAYQNYPLLVGQQTNLYKCVLTNGMNMMGVNGYMGLLTPETIYDDPNGQTLRRELYKHLVYHFQYQNELRLFAEVDHHTKYGGQLLRKTISSPPCFASLNNLFHPNTVDACFAHNGKGLCGGIKDDNGNWNTVGHHNRIVEYTDKELNVLSSTFEDGTTGDCARLVSVHSKEIISVLEKIEQFAGRASDANPIITTAFDETNAVNDGTIKRNTCYPNLENYEMIYNGPQFFVANPLYKSPRKKCVLNSDYDNIDLTSIEGEYMPRTNYLPAININDYCSRITGFYIGQDENGNEMYDNWIDHYKVGFRKMVSLAGERSLICAVLPRRTAHIHGVVSAAFRSGNNTVDMAALSSSLVMDFFIKTVASQNLTPGRLAKLPMGIPQKFRGAMYVRTLLLNCVSNVYSDLWEDVWTDEFKNERWSIDDKRLKSFSCLQNKWNRESPLRNFFERRQALIEIDVVSAMALGLSLKDLETIYTIQFPVLQQNENDTWYDQKGNIVFTCSRGLTGVGCDRPEWNRIHGELSEDGLTYQGTESTYVHTIDPAKSELYGGQQVTYYAPYTKCDRIADYRRAWAHFEKIFNLNGHE